MSIRYPAVPTWGVSSYPQERMTAMTDSSNGDSASPPALVSRARAGMPRAA